MLVLQSIKNLIINNKTIECYRQLGTFDRVIKPTFQYNFFCLGCDLVVGPTSLGDLEFGIHLLDGTFILF